jgi:hypothetical protein
VRTGGDLDDVANQQATGVHVQELAAEEHLYVHSKCSGISVLCAMNTITALQ